MTTSRQLHIDKLSNQFRGVISVSKSPQENEVYISTKKENLVDVCSYIYNTFNASLSSMICNDERSLSKYFKIYYVFSLQDENTFLIVNIPVSEQQPDFPSITPKIPAAHWCIGGIIEVVDTGMKGTIQITTIATVATGIRITGMITGHRFHHRYLRIFYA